MGQGGLHEDQKARGRCGRVERVSLRHWRVRHSVSAQHCRKVVNYYFSFGILNFKDVITVSALIC